MNFFKGTKILITAGPTQEKIDDVRFISNHSSGKMGFAIAEKAFEYGAEVILVSGPVNLKCSSGINRINVVCADDMYNATMEYFGKTDIFIMSAAVADYKPKNPVKGKIKKETAGDSPIIELEKTKDILFEIGKIKNDRQFLVGFALESENLIENAIAKLQRKNCDLIIANKSGGDRSGFGGDYNTISIISKNLDITDYLPMSKSDCAEIILKQIMS
ncbi:MAG: phosphopantothenoylcysteine decarboxylase [Candidatus Kapabacteria bacterium]|nr:phosphopantothenoylcysteine decarboxylase [Ignavibacteriota bacterium]MCW5885688.1 phosphopantothenoylcysteine decarboxylase [Candidatus Kapabacteria bacterium]